MPSNNQVNDRYNPASNMSVDFEEFYFQDLEVDELFWQTNRPEESNPSKGNCVRCASLSFGPPPRTLIFCNKSKEILLF